MLCMVHDTSLNRVGVVHVHPLHANVAHKSKLEVSPVASQTAAGLSLDDATQQFRNISAVTSSAKSPDQLSRYMGAGQVTLPRMAAMRPTCFFQDIATKILSFSQQRPRALCIL